jgi:2-keto-4-pentenoate hydratase
LDNAAEPFQEGLSDCFPDDNGRSPEEDTDRETPHEGQFVMSRLADLAKVFLQIHLSKVFDSSLHFDMASLSLDDAYEIQRRVIAARVAQGDHVVGYKVGCTSKAIRQQFGLSEPICGRLMAPHVHHGDTVLNWDDYVQCAVEPEFVLGIGKDVLAEVEDETELLDVIEWVAPGIEVHNYRFWFGKPTSQELIAGNGIHAGLVIGNQRILPVDLDFDLEGVAIFRNGELAAAGIAAEIMGGPLKSLRWLANHLLRHGEHLEAGRLVIPGSPVELVSVEPGDRITASFTRVGGVSAAFAE